MSCLRFAGLNDLQMDEWLANSAKAERRRFVVESAAASFEARVPKLEDYEVIS